MLRLEGVRRTYGSGDAAIHALADVDVTILPGEFVTIMGPSGCGKSTLLNMMGCLDVPDAGTVHVDGVDVSDLTDAQRARLRARRIGFVFQAFNLYPTLTARGNVELPMMMLGIAPREREERARGLLEQVGLASRMEHLPSELSGGQRQRVAIARALSNDPAYVLADEPTGNLDSQAGREILDLLHAENQNGATMVVVTHDPKVAQESDRTIHMLDGRVVPGP